VATRVRRTGTLSEIPQADKTGSSLRPDPPADALDDQLVSEAVRSRAYEKRPDRACSAIRQPTRWTTTW